MTKTRTASDTAVETVNADAPDDPTVAEAQEFAAEQVASDRAPHPTDVHDARRRRRAARDAAASRTTWDGPSVATVGSLPVNSTARREGRDPEKLAARLAERAVPPFDGPHAIEEATVWVNRDPARFAALELSERAKEDPDEHLLEEVALTIGTDGADVRAERDATRRNRFNRQVRQQVARADARERA